MSILAAPLAQRAVQEVIDQHAFFEQWLDGALPDTDAAFARFAWATDPAFTLIGTDGNCAAADETGAWIRAAHGSRPGFTLWTDEHTVRWSSDQSVLVTYREWQTRDGVTTCLIATALFCANAQCPNGVAWLHVHETWLTTTR